MVDGSHRMPVEGFALGLMSQGFTPPEGPNRRVERNAT